MTNFYPWRQCRKVKRYTLKIQTDFLHLLMQFYFKDALLMMWRQSQKASFQFSKLIISTWVWLSKVLDYKFIILA